MAEQRRRYTKRQKVAAIVAAELTTAKAAAKSTGIPETNIRRWRDDPEMAQYSAKTREEIAEDARALSARVLESIRERLGEFDPRDLSVLFGILTDKSQLLAGQPTERTETRDITATLPDHEKDALADAIDEWLKERADAPA